MDIRRTIFEILSDYKRCDVLLVNIPSRWYKPTTSIFPLANQHYHYTNNISGLLGDQDHEPNHGLLTLCSILRNQKISFELLDLHTVCYLSYIKEYKFDIDSVFMQIVLSTNPHIIGFSSMLPNLSFTLHFASIAKTALPKATLIIGGTATTDINKALCNGLFNFAVIGEADFSLPLLIRNILQHNPVHDINDISNIAYHDHSGNIKFTPQSSKIHPPNFLPEYELLPKELPLIPRIYLTRGCSNQCNFCSPAHFFNNQTRIRKPEDVLSDISRLHELFDFPWYNIGDLTFPLLSKECLSLLNSLSGTDLREWWCQTQVAQINSTNVKLLRQARCRTVALGFETFSSEDTAIRRKTPSQYASEAACNMLREAGINVQGYWLFGLPDDTLNAGLRRIDEISDMLRRDLVNYVHISYFIPYPGTPDYRHSDITIYEDNFSSHLDNENGFYNALPMHRTKHLSREDILFLYLLAIEASSNELLQKKLRTL